MERRSEELRTFLDRLFRKYHREEYLSSDPLEFVHRYADPWDREAVALIAALLAYGNVKQIRRSVHDLLARMESRASSPAAFVRAIDRNSRPALAGFVHRFNRGEDLHVLLRLLGRSWKQHGSLGAHFLSHLQPDHSDIASALNRLISDWRDWAKAENPSESFHYLLTAPEDGSCCKRWCMFLRWMGRRDPGGRMDPGLWTAESELAGTFPDGKGLSARQLVIPLDTHTGRISQYLGLTRRKSLDWKAALEVTGALRVCDAADPVRYDFALARLGILDICQRRYREEICRQCDLVKVCTFRVNGYTNL